MKNYYKLLSAGLIVLVITIILDNYPARGSNLSENLLKVTREDQTGLIFEFISSTNNKIIHHNQDINPSSGRIEVARCSDMPKETALLGIPSNARVVVEILEDQKEMLSGTFTVVQLPTITPLEDDFIHSERKETVLEAELKISECEIDIPIFPESPVEVTADAWLRNHRIARLEVYPYQITDQGQLIWHRYLRVRVSFLGPPEKDNFGNLVSTNYSDPAFEALYQYSLINYETAKSFRSSIDQLIKNDNTLSVSSLRTSYPHAQKLQYRIAVRHDGIYRLSYETLKHAGIPVDGVDPAEIHLSSQGQEVAFTFTDQSGDHKFNPGDAIIFYGQKFRGNIMAQRYTSEDDQWLSYPMQLPDGSYTNWKPTLNATMFEKYTDENVYWLTFDGLAQRSIAQGSSLQMKTNQSLSIYQSGANQSFFPLVARYGQPVYYRSTVHEEQSNISRFTLFNTEDTWFSDQITTTKTVTRTYPIMLSSPALSGGTAILRGEIVAAITNDKSSPDHFVQVYWNKSLAAEPVGQATWDGKSRYRFEYTIPQTLILDGVNEMELVVKKMPSLAIEDLFFDWFEVEYDRRFVAKNNSIEFQNHQTGAWGYQVSGFTTPSIYIFDITDPLKPSQITNYQYTYGVLNFSAVRDTPVSFVAGIAKEVPAADIAVFSPPDLSQPADYIIITHRSLINSAQTLANYRAAQGLATLVVDVNDLYNQFNDGIFHSIAIKNFLTYTFANWSKPPSYVLLVGDGHWNFKSSSAYNSSPILMPPNLAWIDPWQGEVDSANLLATIVGSDPIPDVHIGRIPVNNPTELDAVIHKIIGYEQTLAQEWQRHWLFVTDNPDAAGDFVKDSEDIISAYLPTGYTPDRIYLTNFIQSGICSQNYLCPQMNQAIIDDLNKSGALLVNYAGHSSVNRWASEQFFTVQDIPSLSNGNMLPIFLSMTCLDGYWIHPSLKGTANPGPALAEVLLRADQRGAVATFSATGLGVASGHELLQEGFYDSLFMNNNRILGEAVLSAKLKLFTVGGHPDLLHTYTIFGDPALIIPVQ